jgi:hypothetical protein
LSRRKIPTNTFLSYESNNRGGAGHQTRSVTSHWVQLGCRLLFASGVRATEFGHIRNNRAARSEERDGQQDFSESLIRSESEDGMTAQSAPLPSRKRSTLWAIVAGGLIAGALDLTQAFILFGARVPLVIAAGLLGREATHGGTATYALGVLLHFFIAFSATAVYYAASRRLVFLTEHPVVCGLFYGIAVELVMSFIVLPLSALHDRGPYELHDVLQGLLVHMILIGLPISFSVRRFGR